MQRGNSRVLGPSFFFSIAGYALHLIGYRGEVIDVCWPTPTIDCFSADICVRESMPQCRIQRRSFGGMPWKTAQDNKVTLVTQKDLFHIRTKCLYLRPRTITRLSIFRYLLLLLIIQSALVLHLSTYLINTSPLRHRYSLCLWNNRHMLLNWDCVRGSTCYLKLSKW